MTFISTQVLLYYNPLQGVSKWLFSFLTAYRFHHFHDSKKDKRIVLTFAILLPFSTTTVWICEIRNKSLTFRELFYPWHLPA